MVTPAGTDEPPGAWLPPAERDALVRDQPALVGPVDGMPSQNLDPRNG